MVAKYNQVLSYFKAVVGASFEMKLQVSWQNSSDSDLRHNSFPYERLGRNSFVMILLLEIV